MAITGRLIIFISYPIFDEQGQYLGLVGGSLYLREDNFLNELLGEHFYHDGSYVYVVDAKGHIIYHQDLLRVNDDVSSNQVVQKLMNGQSGAERVSNTEHVDMLAGYAYVPTLGWGIVSQRPTAMALEANRKMIDQMLLNALPILLVSIAVIFFISNLIARPLQRLAVLTESSTKSNEHDRFNKVKAWYYEATQLKRALTFSLGFLHDKVDHITQESNTDPLTKLTNRRTMDRLINQWLLERQMFALVVVDIDHFKQVNDTYGHAVGDKVLVYLAERMKAAAGEQALCTRYGGEEFVILLPNHNRSKAFQIAERLRMLVCEADSPSGDIITISAGIADSSERGQADKLFQLADQRLYKAKHDGRNRSNAG